ncbi:MAG: ABC transporter substrate-binding protein [Dissulfurimicrobium sp.]|uniref:ABC transporter substrate-binding protein n=1 Tax=Dissulfurimicrobium TaxID=1769732 RepID=UPI001EDAAA80|nr:ABC transporter substrate-binding protein [Dissulfurimicrobium hydrothermale]UKL13395.1 ABC transporter substrate-binding protein [Dissulfurimicrobium hydrothermale]
MSLLPLALIYSASISWAAEITCQDYLGRAVKIQVPVKRAVILVGPSDLIPALNIWDKVVGVSTYTYAHDNLLKAAKPDWKDNVVPVASGMADVNIEALLRLRPDIVITWSYSHETVRFMEQNGLRVIEINPKTLHEFYGVIDLFGRLFGRGREAEKTINEMEGIFRLIQKRVSRIPADKIRRVLWVYYGGRPTSVACKGSLLADVLKEIRAVNPASSITQGWGGSADVSMEKIIAWNPDVIFIWGYAPYKALDILNNPQWRCIKAVKDGRVYKAPEWSTWSPRLAPIALWMAMKTYPEYFKDVDFDGVVDRFYRNVFGVSYGEIDKIAQ